jgi:hypothetical protein
LRGEEGDGAFECSRGQARAEHDRVEKDLKEKRNVEQLTQRLIEVKTGGPRESVKLADLPEEWAKTLRRRFKAPMVVGAKGDKAREEKRYVQECRQILNRFVEYLREHHPKAADLLDVTPQMSKEFMGFEETRGSAQQHGITP